MNNILPKDRVFFTNSISYTDQMEKELNLNGTVNLRSFIKNLNDFQREIL